jgi:hypothetical protein
MRVQITPVDGVTKLLTTGVANGLALAISAPERCDGRSAVGA